MVKVSARHNETLLSSVNWSIGSLRQGMLLLLLVTALTLAGCVGAQSETSTGAPAETDAMAEASNSADSSKDAKCAGGAEDIGIENIVRHVAFELDCMGQLRRQWSAFVIVAAIFAYWMISGPLTSRVVQGNSRQRLLPIKVLIVILACALLLFILGSRGENGEFVFLVGTVAVLLVLREPFTDFLAGLTASLERTYEVDDWIEVNDHYGRVTKVGLRSIKLQTPDDSAVSIPHSQIRNATVVNANSAQPTHMCVANLYVQRDHDFRSARRLLWDVAITSPYVLVDEAYPIAVIVVEQPYGLQYRIKAYPRFGTDEFAFVSDLTVRGREALRTLGIEMNHTHPVPE